MINWYNTYTSKRPKWLRSLEWSFYRLLIYLVNMFNPILDIVQPDQKCNLPPIQSDLLTKTISELNQLITSGELTCEQLMSEYLRRIREVDVQINAFSELNLSALQQARDLDQKLQAELSGRRSRDLLDKPLIGIPVTIKNSIAVKGLVQEGGDPSRFGQLSDRDNRTIQQLKDQGAIITGITNVPEFLGWFECKTSHRGTTLNPYDPSRTVGGSSGGEGAALASACSLVGVGSDMLGSCRMPALYCGVFGHKPTTHFVETLDGMMPVYPREFDQLLTLGPMTRYASDLKPMLKAIVKPDRLEELRLDQPVDLTKLKFYYLDSDYSVLTPTSEDIKTSMRKAMIHLEEKFGARFERIQLPKIENTLFLWLSQIDSFEPRYLGSWLLFGKRSKFQLGARIIETLKSLIWMSRHCTYILMACWLEVLPNPTAKNRGIREAFKKEVNRIIDDQSVLLMPTLPEPAFKHGQGLAKFLDMSLAGWVNIAKLPATHIPMGLNSKGLPVGFQVISGQRADRNCLAIAEELERAFGGWQQPVGSYVQHETDKKSLFNRFFGDNRSISRLSAETIN